MAVVNEQKTQNYRLLESVYPSRLKQARHTHLDASFSVVLAGSYVETCGGRSASRRPSTIVFHPPEESHAVEYTTRARILSVRFSHERFNEIRQHSVILDKSSVCTSKTVARLGARIHRELKRMDSFSWLSIDGMILELLAEASRRRAGRESKAVPSWLNDVRHFLHDNLTESFTLADIATTVGVHPVHLSRAFRRTYGSTVGEYVRRLRVEFAGHRIVTTDKTLGEIAHAAGFADQSHFNKAFKELYGMLPSEYRRNSRSR